MDYPRNNACLAYLRISLRQVFLIHLLPIPLLPHPPASKAITASTEAVAINLDIAWQGFLKLRSLVPSNYFLWLWSPASLLTLCNNL